MNFIDSTFSGIKPYAISGRLSSRPTAGPVRSHLFLNLALLAVYFVLYVPAIAGDGLKLSEPRTRVEFSCHEGLGNLPRSKERPFVPSIHPMNSPKNLDGVDASDARTSAANLRRFLQSQINLAKDGKRGHLKDAYEGLVQYQSHLPESFRLGEAGAVTYRVPSNLKAEDCAARVKEASNLMAAQSIVNDQGFVKISQMLVRLETKGFLGSKITDLDLFSPHLDTLKGPARDFIDKLRLEAFRIAVEENLHVVQRLKARAALVTFVSDHMQTVDSLQTNKIHADSESDVTMFLYEQGLFWGDKTAYENHVNRGGGYEKRRQVMEAFPVKEK